MKLGIEFPFSVKFDASKISNMSAINQLISVRQNVGKQIFLDNIKKCWIGSERIICHQQSPILKEMALNEVAIAVIHNF